MEVVRYTRFLHGHQPTDQPRLQDIYLYGLRSNRRQYFLSHMIHRENGPKRSHQLRYVLRNRATGQVYLVVHFTLYLKEDVNEDGSLKPAALQATKKASGGLVGSKENESGSDAASFDEQKALDEARRKLSGVALDGEKIETRDDDVD